MKKFKRVCELQSKSNGKIVSACLGDLSGDLILASDDAKFCYLWKRGSLEPITVILN